MSPAAEPYLLAGLGALWLLLLGAVVLDRVLRPRCPACGSKRTVCCGAWQWVEFRRCLSCDRLYDRDTREKAK